MSRLGGGFHLLLNRTKTSQKSITCSIIKVDYIIKTKKQRQRRRRNLTLLTDAPVRQTGQKSVVILAAD